MTERERFEAWARQRWTHPEDFDQRIKAPSKYNNYEVQAAWDAWQERAAQPAQSVPEREFLERVIGLCSHRGSSPSSIEAFDPEDKWIADLWRQAKAMLAAAPEAKP